MRVLFLSILCALSFAAKSQQNEGMADISGVWVGYFYQHNFLDPSGPDLAYKAVMNIDQNDGTISGHCYIFWFDDERFYGNWKLEGNYNGNEFDYRENEISENNPKPGYSWCVKNVESFVTYNAELGKWMITGEFNGHTDYSDCSPGTLTLYKEGDI